MIVGKYGRSTKCRHGSAISEPCFEMVVVVVDVKFHPVMALVLLPVELPDLLRIHRYEKVVLLVKQ